MIVKKKKIMGYKCRYCGSRLLEFVYYVDSYELIKCKKCKLLQTKVSTKELKNINYSKYNSLYLNDYTNERSKELIIFYKSIIKKIEKYYNKGKLLDYGCSTGLFLKTIKMLGDKWNLYGIDINKKSINRAKSSVKAKFNLGFLKKNTYQINFFNVITCFDVLEHDINLTKTIKILHIILKKKGIIIIQVPNYQSLMAYLTKDKWDWWCIPDHLYHFSIETITKVLVNNRFKIISLTTRQPKHFFIENIRGVIRERLTNYQYLNKFIAKISYFLLYVLWLLLKIFDSKIKKGGLILIIAQKI